MDDDDEVYEISVDVEAPSYPLTNGVLIAEAMNFMASQASVTAAFMERLALRVSADANFTVDQNDFAAEAAKEIETISAEGES